MNGKNRSAISRREFARRAAIVSAASLVPPVALPTAGIPAQTVSQAPSDSPGLSAEGQAEAEARYQTILAIYGGRFSETEKSEIRRQSFLAQPALDHIRAFKIENGDGPALYLKPLVEREKTPSSTTISHPQSPATKNP